MTHEAYDAEPMHGAASRDAAAPATLDGVLAPASEWLADKREALEAGGPGLRAGARACIASYPWQAVVAAAGVGYCLARWPRR